MRNNNELKVGSRVSVSNDIDLEPYATIRAGERVTIVAVWDTFVEFVPDKHHAGLREYANVAWVDTTYVDPTQHFRALNQPACVTPLRKLAAAALLGFFAFAAVEPALATALNIPSTVLAAVDDWLIP